MEILTEYLEVLARMGLAGEPELKELLELFKTRQGVDFVVIENDLHAIKADPAGDKFLECAIKSRAACIVSGGRHLKDLGEFEGILVLSPADFMNPRRKQ